MKKLFCFTMGLLSSIAILFAQQQITDVPLDKRKVVFAQTLYAPLNKDEIYTKLATWVERDFASKSTIVRVKDEEKGVIVLQNTCLLEIEKKALSLYQVYMRYTLVIECEKNQCTVQMRNINYLEASELNNSNAQFLPAETVIVGDSYKVAFVKNASQKIKDKSLEYVNLLFMEVQMTMNN